MQLTDLLQKFGEHQTVAIAMATLLSEDLACIAAGAAVRAKQLSLLEASAAAGIGIFMGDVALWVCGYILSFLANTNKLSRNVQNHPKYLYVQSQIQSHFIGVLFGSRFVPGLRLPVYLLAGHFRTPFLKTLLVFALASLVWAPALVAASSVGHGWIENTLGSWFGKSIFVTLASALLALLILKTIYNSIVRLRHFEFWPSWLTYLPLVPYVLWLAIKNRSLMAPTASNPFIPHSGMVGESKSQILRLLPPEWTLKHELISVGEPAQRLAKIAEIFSMGVLSFPVVLKPDAGQRGAGVKLCRNIEEVELYIAQNPQPFLVQQCHLGPREIGVFYLRHPELSSGRIFSITDKVFPIIAGDGLSTLEQLIQMHPRYSLQSKVFKARHDHIWKNTLEKDKQMQLCFAGNHCQGTLFCDGQSLVTKELEKRIDEIAKHVDGFHFGRFDIRFSCEHELRAGRGFSILELNGATSESTNIYDPSWSVLRSYKVLFLQWRLLFEIGAANIKKGHKASKAKDLVKTILDFYRERKVNLISD